MKTMRKVRRRFMASLFLVARAVLEASPQQHGDDHGEHDHLLEGARVEGAEALEQPDEERADRAGRVAREAAEDRGDEALEADQEAGVVEERGRGPDQEAGERAHE